MMGPPATPDWIVEDGPEGEREGGKGRLIPWFEMVKPLKYEIEPLSDKDIGTT